MKNLHELFYLEIKPRIADHTQALISNNVDNMHSYGYACGVIAGLEMSLSIFNDLWEKKYKQENFEE
jgi:hypothetical protein